MSSPNDDFFIGYLPKMPQSRARYLHRLVILILVILPLIAWLLVSRQAGFSAAVYEFGDVKDFEGVILEKPYPMLAVLRPGNTDPQHANSLYYLVGPAKSGAASEVAGMDSSHVRLKGTLLYHDDQTMIEVVPGSVEKQEGQTTNINPKITLENISLKGEIVDSKCFLGVMKPGNLKTHRSCAKMCIRGGIPPVLVVRNQEGVARYFVLAGRDGQPINNEVLPLVAEPVRVTGNLVLQDSRAILYTDPNQITLE